MNCLPFANTWVQPHNVGMVHGVHRFSFLCCMLAWSVVFIALVFCVVCWHGPWCSSLYFSVLWFSVCLFSFCVWCPMLSVSLDCPFLIFLRFTFLYPLVGTAISAFWSRSWFITIFLTPETRQVPLLEQEPFNLPEHPFPRGFMCGSCWNVSRSL